MWKGIVAGTVVLALAGSTLVYAQRGDRGYHGGDRGRPTVEDMRAFGEARLAALKAGLTLTPEQEKNWPAFEAAARDYGKFRIDQRTAMRNAAPTRDPAERLRQRATSMADTSTVLKKLADATDPLYKSLDDNQKRRFAILARLGGSERGHWQRGRGPGGPHGFGPRRTGGDEGFEPQGGMRL
jgi:hypothetical protein